MKDFLSIIILAAIVIIGFLVLKTIIGFVFAFVWNLLIIAVMVLVVLALFKYVTSGSKKRT